MIKIPTSYVGPLRTPLPWTTEPSGVLSAAILAIIYQGLKRAEASREQFELVRAYCQYFAGAPCFDGTPAVEELRTAIKEARQFEELQDWLLNALLVGIDPI